MDVLDLFAGAGNPAKNEKKTQYRAPFELLTEVSEWRAGIGHILASSVSLIFLGLPRTL
jgi:hypothetical protein